MPSLTIILFPGILTSSISLPLELFHAADNIQRGLNRHHKAITVNLAGRTLDPIKTSGGLIMSPNCTIDEISHSDFVIIPALWRNPIQAVKRHSWLTQWLSQSSLLLNSKICAVGTGSAFLAEANILNKKAATTHWFYYDLMKENYPNVDWKRQHLITQSGNIYCTGSINSIADLCIHFIQQNYSINISKRVESQFSPEVRRAFDDHLFDEDINVKHHDELIANAQDVIQQRLFENIDFSQLAQTLGVSSRTFQRRFKAACNYTPLQYQQDIRIENAKQLLKNSNLSIQEVASSVGYVDASHFARIFKSRNQQSPKSYRNAVRGKLFKTQG